MVLSAEQKCLLWLSIAEITPQRVADLSEAYHGPEGIWEEFGKKNGPKFAPVSLEKLIKYHSRDAMDDIITSMEKKNVKLLFRSDERYPAQLDTIDDPPYLIYYAGRLDCFLKPCIAIVGTRTPSSYGRGVAYTMAKELCEAGVCVVSGLAFGIDESVHQAALAVNGKTIGVLGSGINNPYPAEHTPMLRKIAGGAGLIISEYPLDAEPVPYHFPHRNRIISGLSHGVVLVEGKIRSGGMVTVATALTQGRNVFAVPGQIGSTYAEGPLAILREGARIITCAQDILDDIDMPEGISDSRKLMSRDGSIAPPHKKENRESINLQELSQVQRNILSCLKVEALRLDELTQRIPGMMDSDLILTELSIMEVLGYVQREPGNLFALPPFLTFIE